MSRPRSIALAVITVGVTLGSGLVAENRDAIEARMGVDVPDEVSGRAPAIVTALLAPGSRVLGASLMEDAAPWDRVVGAPDTPDPSIPALSLAALVDAQPTPFLLDGWSSIGVFSSPNATIAASEGIEVPGEVSGETPGEACRFRVEAAPAPAASVSLAVWAPCAAGEALTVTHEGMALRVPLDDLGRASLVVPALATPAAFALAAGGAAAVASAEVPDLVLFDRTVLQWRGSVGPDLHAREFSEADGGARDVWSGAPGDLAGAVAGLSGVMTTLGDPDLPSPLMAQVYTSPSGVGRQTGAVALTVEAQVSEANCGRALVAQVIQVSAGSVPLSSDLELPLPGCDSLGERVVLDDAVLALTVAAL